jgi:hypothetical protein
VHSEQPLEAVQFLEARRASLGRHPDLEWLLVHAFAQPGIDEPRALELYRRLESRKSPLTLFVSGLANEQGLSFEVSNVGRSMEFLARTLITSKHARGLLRAGGDYGRPQAEAEVVAAELARHVLYTIRPGEPGERVGRAASTYGAAGDVDKDGCGDFFVSFVRGHHEQEGVPLGQVYSGRDGALLRTYALQPIPPPSTGFDPRTLVHAEPYPSMLLVLVPDVDGDEVPEHVIVSTGMSVPSKRAVLSGATGQELRGPAARVLAAGFLSVVGDMDRDGAPELLRRVGERGAGFVSLGTGEVVGTTFELVGGQIAAAGDLDGDGSIDLIAGDRFDDRRGINSGCLRLYSVWDGERGAARGAPLLLHEILGKSMQDYLGTNVGSLGDVDGDGRADVYASEHWAADRGFQTGRVRAFSGVTGAELYAVLGDVPLGKFGHQMQVVGDLDGDGHRDLGIPSLRSSRNGRYSGSLSVFSARTEARLLTIDGPGPGAGLGFGLADAGDVNGDGTPDLICAALWPGDGAELAQPAEADLLGTVYVLSGRPVR